MQLFSSCFNFTIMNVTWQIVQNKCVTTTRKERKGKERCKSRNTNGSEIPIIDLAIEILYRIPRVLKRNYPRNLAK